MLGIGTGWLGWGERETLETRMSTILAAYEARVDLLNAVFGGGKKEKAAQQPATAQAVDAFFSGLMGSHA